MTDKQLCAAVYLHYDFPLSDFRAHWLLDTRSGVLRQAVKTVYRAILRSIEAK